MKDDLDRIESKVDKLDEKLDSVDKTLVKQEMNLQQHMRRTEIQEESLEVLKKYMHNEVEPIKDHIKKVSAITKFMVGAVSALSAIVAIVYKILGN